MLICYIGYGNVAPKTKSGRLFCILYGLCGIPLCLVWISELGSFFGDRAKRLSQVLIRKGVSVVRNDWILELSEYCAKRYSNFRKLEHHLNILCVSFLPFLRKRSSLPAQPYSCYGGFWCILWSLHLCSCLLKDGTTWKASTSHSLHSQLLVLEIM